MPLVKSTPVIFWTSWKRASTTHSGQCQDTHRYTQNGIMISNKNRKISASISFRLKFESNYNSLTSKAWSTDNVAQFPTILEPTPKAFLILSSYQFCHKWCTPLKTVMSFMNHYYITCIIFYSHNRSSILGVNLDESRFALLALTYYSELHGFRLLLGSRLFLVDFDHFWIKNHFWGSWAVH